MTELYLDYEEYTTGGEICAGQENDAWPNYEPEYTVFSPRALYRDREAVSTWLCETIEIPKGVTCTDVAFLVVVRYTTGSTFGTCYGRWCLDGIYTDPKEAAEIARKIEADENSHGNLGSGYTPWKGYFERFEHVDMIPVSVY